MQDTGTSSIATGHNHINVSPDGRRFTVKLRWRRKGGPWNDTMGVSLTSAVDGTRLRLLTDATSHVIWRDPNHLYFWRRQSVEVLQDARDGGRKINALALNLNFANVHIRHLDADAE